MLDAWGARLREIPVAKNPACPVCGDDPSITELSAPAESCTPATRPESSGTAESEPSENNGNGEGAVSAAELRGLLKSAEPPALLDVREDVEVALEPMGGARHIQ